MEILHPAPLPCVITVFCRCLHAAHALGAQKQLTFSELDYLL